MTFIINPHRFGVANWDAYVASLSPWAWWKLDEDTFAVEGDLDVNDATGNGRKGVYSADSANPTRHTSALVTGSSFSVTAGINRNIRDNATNFLANLTAGSFTFGAFFKGTGTTTTRRLVQQFTGFTGLAVFLNYPASGDLRMYWDTGGTDPNSLLASGTGWNDGNTHLLMFEYDSDADTISIWKDGTEIATRSRAGTKPTPTGQHEWLFLSTTPLSGTQCDEYLFFTRVLTATEHSTLASYAA